MLDHGNHDHNSRHASVDELDLRTSSKRKGFLAPHTHATHLEGSGASVPRGSTWLLAQDHFDGGAVGNAFVFQPSPYKTKNDLPIPDPRPEREKRNPSPTDAPIGEGLEELPFGHPWKRNPTGGGNPGAVEYWSLLYRDALKWTARFTNDGYIISDLVDISEAVKVFFETRPNGEQHIAARLDHDSLQRIHNSVATRKKGEKKPEGAPKSLQSEMPLALVDGNAFFNDLDDIGIELKPPASNTSPTGPKGSSRGKRARAEAERFFKNKKSPRVVIPVRYVWTEKKNPVHPDARPKGPPQRPPAK